MEIRITEGFDQFLALKPDWDELALKTPSCRLTQTFGWAQIAWENRVVGSQDRLVCASLWNAATLVAIWPFAITKVGLIKRAAPLGCTMQEEYGEPLLACDIDQESACEELLKVVRQFADTFYVYCAPYGTPIQSVLARSGVYNIPVSLDAYSIEWEADRSIEQVMASYSGNFRKNLKQLRKKILIEGELSFEAVEDHGTCLQTIAWILATKRDWVERNNKECPWLYERETAAFFNDALSLGGELGKLGLFRLTLNGKTIVAFLMTIDRTRMEGFITSFDPDYSRFSVGMLLMEDVLAWGYERGLSFDMRPLHLDYKERWSSKTTSAICYHIPLTLKGAAHLSPAYGKFKAKQLARRYLSQNQRTAIRSMLDWRRLRKARSERGAGKPAS